MAYEVKVEMLRAVGGFEVGATRALRVTDAERLEARGVVKIIGSPTNAAAPARPIKPAKRKAAPRTRNQATKPANKRAKAPANKAG